MANNDGPDHGSGRRNRVKWDDLPLPIIYGAAVLAAGVILLVMGTHPVMAAIMRDPRRGFAAVVPATGAGESVRQACRASGTEGPWRYSVFQIDHLQERLQHRRQAPGLRRVHEVTGLIWSHQPRLSDFLSRQP